MKIPVQEKIAELEQRIADLEDEAYLHFGFARREYRRMDTKEVDRIFGPHWVAMWKEFRLMMGEIFR